ncbi:MAG: DUF1003 domain-containing protein [Chamaesiphon sp.]
MRNIKTSDVQNSVQKAQTSHYQSKVFIPTAPLPDPIGQNIEAVIALHTRAEKDVPRHQRLVEDITAFFGRTAFLYWILVVVILWVLFNVLPPRFNLPKFDPPPFDWLEGSLSLGGFLMTVGVLIRQNRQEKLAEQRAQLSLQLNLLSEQKIAKIIALIEELRSDLPNVQNRHDPESEVMKQAADPQAVMEALEETLAQELAQQQTQDTLIG